MNAAPPSIAIIGGGFAGIACAVRLVSAGFANVTIIEQAAGLGGTWWHNTYPGAEVDTPSVLYSYSFAPHTWTRTHARRAELLDYLDGVIDGYGLRRRAILNTKVDRVEWHAATAGYHLYAGGREVLSASFVVSAVGLLSDPRPPDLPGLAEFRGPAFHSAAWDHTVDLAGRRVAVIGSGSTAAQLVPALSETAGQVLLFQREPGWVIPKRAREFSPLERAALGSRLGQRLARLSMLYDRERGQRGSTVVRPGTKLHAAAEKAARGYIHATLGGDPHLAELVTPAYPFGGKRTIISDDFYPSLLRQNVTLVPSAAVRATETGLIDSTGAEHPVDAIVLATGFSARFLSTLEVIGRGGRALHEVWGDEPRAFLGMMTPGFPNFFVMYGPNTNGGAIVSNLEVQAAYILAAVRRTSRRSGSAIEIREWAFERFDQAVQKRLKGTAYHLANNYYKGAHERITTQWGGGLMSYSLLARVLRTPVWRISRPAAALDGARSLPKALASTRVLLRQPVSSIMKPYDAAEATADAEPSQL
jgi:cation diffusion facilitator CzcD-associated flavoprotein CzcO